MAAVDNDNDLDDEISCFVCSYNSILKCIL